MKTEKDYYSNVLQKISQDLKGSAKFFLNSTKNTGQYEHISAEVLEQISECFYGKGTEVPALNNFDIYFYELLAQTVLNANPNIEQMRKICSTIFKEQSINLLLDNMTQDNVELIYSMISEHKFTTEESLQHIESIFSIVNDHLNKEMTRNYFDYDEPESGKLKLDINRLKKSLQDLLKNHVHYLKNDIAPEVTENFDFDHFDGFDTDSLPDNRLYSEKILDNIKKIFPNEAWHEFTNLLPVLPQRDPSEPLFSVNQCPIVELDVNNRAVLGIYHDLMTEQDIYNMLNTTMNAINLCSLPGINYIKNMGFASEKEFSLLVKSSNENLPPIEKVEKLLNLAFHFYHEYSEKDKLLNVDSNIYKKFIEKEWLDLSVPLASKAKTLKKKI